MQPEKEPIAQLKAEVEEIVENPDGAAEPEVAPPLPKKSKGLAAILLNIAPDKPQRAEVRQRGLQRSLITTSCCQILILMLTLCHGGKESNNLSQF